MIIGVSSCEKEKVITQQASFLDEILDNLTEFLVYYDSFDAIESRMYCALQLFADEPSTEALSYASAAIKKAQEDMNALPIPGSRFTEADSDKFAEVNVMVDNFLFVYSQLSVSKSNFFLLSDIHYDTLVNMTDDPYIFRTVFCDSLKRDVDYISMSRKNFFLLPMLLLCKAEADVTKNYRKAVIETLDSYTKYDITWETDRNVIIGKITLYMESLSQRLTFLEKRQGDIRMLKLTNSDYFIPLKAIVEYQDEIFMTYFELLAELVEYTEEPTAGILDLAYGALEEAQTKIRSLSPPILPKPDETRHDFSFFIDSAVMDYDFLTDNLDAWASILDNFDSNGAEPVIIEVIKSTAVESLEFWALYIEWNFLLANRELVFEKNIDTFWNVSVDALRSYQLFGRQWESDYDELCVEVDDISKAVHLAAGGSADQ